MESLEKLKQLKPVLVGLLAAVALVLVVQNQEAVHTRVLIWQVEMPRFALLGTVYLLGAATGWVVHWKVGRSSSGDRPAGPEAADRGGSPG